VPRLQTHLVGRCGKLNQPLTQGSTTVVAGARVGSGVSDGRYAPAKIALSMLKGCSVIERESRPTARW